jgi:hypothetical protein
MSDPENPGECECCGYQTDKLKLFKNLDTTLAGGGKVIKTDFWYCDLCASTPASNVHRYPGQYGRVAEAITRTVCYVGNLVLAAVGKTGGT